MFHVEHFWDRGATSHSSNCSTWNTALVSSGVERGCSTWNIAFPPQRIFSRSTAHTRAAAAHPIRGNRRLVDMIREVGRSKAAEHSASLTKDSVPRPPPRSLRARLKRITEEIRTPLSAIHEKRLADFRVCHGTVAHPYR